MEGIVVGADERQEWLLPWWWDNYRRHNEKPVAFVDFGLSEKMRDWCRKRGALVRLPFIDVAHEVEPSLANAWEGRFGNSFWASRNCWFKKPHACLASPFQKSVWLDVDCEVRGPLNPLFDRGDFALAKDQGTTAYNSGVIVFTKNHPLLREWANQSERENRHHRGDQDLLTHIIVQQEFFVEELPPIYNWNVGFGARGDLVVCHWLGELGKEALRHQIKER